MCTYHELAQISKLDIIRPNNKDYKATDHGYIRMSKINWSLMLRIILITALIALISACSTIGIKDGPPRFNVDVSKIPNAVPKVEAKSKYGNPSTYVVDGYRYHVLSSADGYVQRGIASWYGTKFHGHLTSTREPYNMLAMTGASPTLPIPCYARVTNLRNGKSIIVRINDRGPFAPHRILDLSYAAAKKLGYIGTGTAYVQVAAIDPRYPYRSSFNHQYAAAKQRNYVTHATHYYAQAKPQNYATSATHHYAETKQRNIYLQLGAFAQYENALRLESRVRYYTNRPVHIAESETKQRRLYRVQIGPLLSATESYDVREKLQRAGLGTAYNHST